MFQACQHRHAGSQRMQAQATLRNRKTNARTSQKSPFGKDKVFFFTGILVQISRVHHDKISLGSISDMLRGRLIKRALQCAAAAATLACLKKLPLSGNPQSDFHAHPSTRVLH